MSVSINNCTLYCLFLTRYFFLCSVIQLQMAVYKNSYNNGTDNAIRVQCAAEEEIARFCCAAVLKICWYLFTLPPCESVKALFSAVGDFC